MRRDLIPYLLLTFSIALVDIVTKLVVQSNMQLHESHEVFGSFFKITYVLNYGGVFGSRLGSNFFYLVSAIIVVLLVVFFLVRELGKNRYIDLALFVVLGGAIGNLFDRIRMGAVVDFLDFDFFNINILGYRFDRWPTFNIADVAVTVGMIIIVAAVIFGFGRAKDSEENTEDK